MPAKDLLVESEMEKPGNLTPVGAGHSRRFERYYFRALATAVIYPAAGQKNQTPQLCYVLTRDLSRGGVSILHPVPLCKGQRLDLELTDGRKYTLSVQWIKRLDRHCFCMGCCFVSIDAE
jgi:hypothetical protein